MRRWILGAVITLLVIAGSIAFEQYRYNASLFEELQEKLALKNYEAVRRDLHELPFAYLTKKVELIENGPFTRAIKTIMKLHGVPEKELLNMLEAAFYIEAYGFEKGHYIAKEESHLVYDIEYDPETKRSFIHLDKLLGKGKKKQVFYSLLYDERHPELVARALSQVSLDREMETTKLFRDALGIYAVKALTKIRHKDKVASAIISKLYNKGSLYSLFSKIYKKKFKPLSLREKLSVASHILQGLSNLHEQGVAHRDLSSKNYFVSVHEQKGRRRIEVVIADLERALHTKDKTGLIRDAKVQGNRSYTPPEAVMRRHFEPSEFFPMDVYATGCVLYELFYQKRPEWRRERFGKDGRTQAEAHAELVQSLEICTKKRRDELESKKERNAEEELERLVLQMVHVEPAARGAAASIKSQLDSIVAKL